MIHRKHIKTANVMQFEKTYIPASNFYFYLRQKETDRFEIFLTGKNIDLA